MSAVLVLATAVILVTDNGVDFVSPIPCSELVVDVTLLLQRCRR